MLNFLEIGGRIRRIRRSLNMTQDQVAELAGISHAFYGHIERGTRRPSLETLYNICLALNADLGKIVLG